MEPESIKPVQRRFTINQTIRFTRSSTKEPWQDEGDGRKLNKHKLVERPSGIFNTLVAAYQQSINHWKALDGEKKFNEIFDQKHNTMRRRKNYEVRWKKK